MSDAGAIRTVLFDAGGVLVQLDLPYLRRLVEAKRIDVEPQALVAAEAAARREVHRMVESGGRVGSAWRDYFHLILGKIGLPGPEQSAVIDSLWDAHERFGLWTVASEGGPETVSALRESGLRLGVVSNAEGRVERDLETAGYKGAFDTIVDSHHVGVEKPDPAIFGIALERLGVDPEATVYVGDLPAVDVQGARAAGIRAILVDPHDHYADCDAPRIRTLRELPDLLARGIA